ncbi:transporter smf2 [Moniliophthora roreri]|nr:transporter smf2 [Moniliophthora roreri]
MSIHGPSQNLPEHRASHRIAQYSKTIIHHVRKHVGVGIICAVAYFDPGNWSVDLQAGADFGYRPMLFVILLSGLDLASHCRLLLHDHPTHPRLVRRAVLYPLYVCAEVAIVCTDLAELLGSAIGLCLIFPRLPLYAGVILTAVDILVFLLFADPSRGNGRPVKMFELVIIGLVVGVFSCFVVLIVKVKPDWPRVFLGYIPSKNLFQFQPNAVYAAVGILGATIMPHALFLGSYLATQDRVSLQPPSEYALPVSTVQGSITSRLKAFCGKFFYITKADRTAAVGDYRTKYGERTNNSLSFIRQHLYHTITDVVTSLLGFAIPINSAILILAATVFHGRVLDKTTIGLFDAHDLIQEDVGKGKAHPVLRLWKYLLETGAAFLFALALLCAGQTASITATLAGQVVSEGFIEWRMSPFLRRLITRLISLVPSVAVSVSVGREGVDTLLVASQVVLSVTLPFLALPLIYLTSSAVVMQVVRPPTPFTPTSSGLDEKEDFECRSQMESSQTASARVIGTETLGDVEINFNDSHASNPDNPESDTASTIQEYLDFSNGRIVTTFAYAIWGLIVIANVYAIVMLALGRV